MSERHTGQNKHEKNSSASHAQVRVVIQPRVYLDQFYAGELDPGSKALLRFYANCYGSLNGGSLLEFGGGPTIYSLITAAPRVSWIHFTDYNLECLEEVRSWVANESTAFDWTEHIKYALASEFPRISTITADEVQARATAVRERITIFSRCDAFSEDPLLGNSRAPYDVVANNFCLDGITNDKDVWYSFNKKLAQEVADGGLFVTVSLLDGVSWTVGDMHFPAVRLNMADVVSMYEALGFTVTKSETFPVEGRTGYRGFIMVSGRKNR